MRSARLRSFWGFACRLARLRIGGYNPRHHLVIARVFLLALVLSWRAEIEARGIRTVACGFELGLPSIRIFPVEHVAIRVHRRRHVVGALRAAFDFDAIDARFRQFAQVGKHIHVS